MRNPRRQQADRLNARAKALGGLRWGGVIVPDWDTQHGFKVRHQSPSGLASFTYHGHELRSYTHALRWIQRQA